MKDLRYFFERHFFFNIALSIGLIFVVNIIEITKNEAILFIIFSNILNVLLMILEVKNSEQKSQGGRN